MDIQNEIRRLPVKLTENELLIKGQELADLERQLSEVEDEKREVSKEFSGRIEGMKNRISETANTINSKQEIRDVEVAVSMDYKSLTVRVVRTDTGEIVSERLMSDKERQSTLKFPKEAEGKDSKKSGGASSVAVPD